MPPAPDEELREAFRRHGDAAGRRWQAQVYGISRSDGKLLTVRVDLTCDDARVLATLMRAGTSLRGGFADGRLGTAAVARHIHVSEPTIRSWLARNLPRHNPFPRPEKHLGRNQWQRAVIDAWQARQVQLEKQKPRGAPHGSDGGAGSLPGRGDHCSELA